MTKELVTALDAFVGDLKGTEVRVSLGEVFEANHAIVKKWPTLFGPVADVRRADEPVIEQATAAPGEKRTLAARATAKRATAKRAADKKAKEAAEVVEAEATDEAAADDYGNDAILPIYEEATTVTDAPPSHWGITTADVTPSERGGW